LPASPYSNAQQARELLASRLVEIMRDAGLKGRTLAARVGWYESKVSRIVNATTPPSEDDVRAWCVACGADDEIPDLIASLRDARGMWVEWRRMERSGLRVAQEQILPLYERTHAFRAYSPSLIPGMIQTPAYLSAVLRAIQQRRGLIDDVEEAVAIRMERQQLLRDPGKRFAFVIEECVLRYLIADVEATAAQLGHLLEVQTLPNVFLGVIPATVPRGLWPVEAFWIYDSEQAAAELVSGYLTLTQPREVALYEQAFTELSEIAVFGPDSRRLITAALEALG
jgi:hypothetical protein